MSFLISSYNVEPCGFSAAQCRAWEMEPFQVSELNRGEASVPLQCFLTPRWGAEERAGAVESGGFLGLNPVAATFCIWDLGRGSSLL